MKNNTEQIELARSVRSKLAALRRRIRRYVWLEGTMAAVIWLGVAFWASLGIDWLFEPSREVRALLLGIVAAGLAWVLFQRIIRRAFVRLSDRNMAMLLERHFPEFDESLLTAVELTQRTAEPGWCSREMLARTCRRAEEPIRAVRLRRVFNPAPLARSTLAAIVLSAAVWAFGWLAPEALATWTERSLLLGDAMWPRQTRLLVEGFEHGSRKVARGADLEVIAKADVRMPVVPQVVQVRYQGEGGASGRAAMSREGTVDPARDDFQEYSHTFRGVLASIHFDVVGGDAAVRDLSIEVVDSPTIVEMVLDCRFPPYMDRPRRTLPVTGVMQLPVGTDVTVRATTNKELVKVEIDDGEESYVGVETRETDLRSFAYTLPNFTEDKTLLFTLFDTDGIKSRRPARLALAAVADAPPQLSVELRGIASAVTPQARVPAEGQITDDYGVARVWFEYGIDEGEPATRPLESPSGNPTDFHLDRALEVRDLKLTAGQRLLVCVKAADRYDLAERPNVGTSRRWVLDVVTPDQLRTMLEARELVLRQRFERIAQEVTETRDSLQRMSFDWSSAEEEGEENQSEETEPNGGEEADSQRAVSLSRLRVGRALQNSRKNAHETLGLAEAFVDIREELVNNRVDTAELKIRLEQGIADPLRRIGEELFPELDRRLDRLEAALALEAGPDARDQAVAQVDAILQAIEEVLGRMLELEDFNKAVELLREIIDLQEKLGEQTRERRNQKLRELLED